jgi:transcriptional regulator with XRE-family HTH domain
MYKERISTVSERLKEAMQLKGIRQIDLCRMCQIPKGAMSLYISGAYEPKQDRLQSLAVALGVDIAWLMGYDTNMSPNKEQTSPTEPKLTEGEEMLLELFRRIPEDKQELVLQMIRVALSSQ